MTEYYIGTKRVLAYPQNKFPENGIMLEGYTVQYEDGYTSWSPKEVFEKAYLPMGFIPIKIEGPIGAQDAIEVNMNKITLDMVNDFIIGYNDCKMGDKTTVVTAILRNGFEVTESASCVDPATYNREVGMSICIKRITDKVWMMLGFLLQTALEGIEVDKGNYTTTFKKF